MHPLIYCKIEVEKLSDAIMSFHDFRCFGSQRLRIFNMQVADLLVTSSVVGFEFVIDGS